MGPPSCFGSAERIPQFELVELSTRPWQVEYFLPKLLFFWHLRKISYSLGLPRFRLMPQMVVESIN